MKHTNVQKLVYTAICLAILIAVQVITKPFGQIVTGSLVNFILIIATLTAGIAGGTAVAILSPFLAFSIGIGTPILQIVPMIALGNLAVVLLFGLLFKTLHTSEWLKWIISILVSAVVKFLVLYIGIVRVILPLLTALPPKQAAAISATFSVPQLITALIGGFIAFIVVPLVQKATKNK